MVGRSRVAYGRNTPLIASAVRIRAFPSPVSNPLALNCEVSRYMCLVRGSSYALCLCPKGVPTTWDVLRGHSAATADRNGWAKTNEWINTNLTSGSTRPGSFT